jgi:hypothetical protein
VVTQIEGNSAFVFEKCVDNKLHNVCPNYGGGFAPRPIRPVKQWRPGVCTEAQPPSDKRVHLNYSLEQVAEHSAWVGSTPPELR